MSALRPLTRLLARHSVADFARAGVVGTLLHSHTRFESASASYAQPLADFRIPLAGLPPVMARGTGQVGITFAPFPKNELHIRQFNLKRELAKRRELFLADVGRLIGEMKSGSLSVDTTRETCDKRILERVKRPISSKEARVCHEMVLKTFDPAAFDRHVLAEETRLLEAIAATLKEVRAMTNDTADRPMVNRNRVSFMLEKHLGRFPDPDEVEALWSRRVEASAVLWSEGGDLVRDQSEMYSDQIQYGSHMDSL